MNDAQQAQQRLFHRVFAALFDTSPQQSPLAPRLLLSLALTVLAAGVTALFPDEWQGGRFAAFGVATVLAALLGGWQAGTLAMLGSLVLIDLAMVNWQPGVAFYSWQQALLLNASHFTSMGLTIVATGLLQERNQRLQESMARAEFEHQHFIDNFEKAAVGMAHVAPSGTILMANKTLCNMLGLIKTEIDGTLVEDHLEPQQTPTLLPRLHALAAGNGKQVQFECRLRSAASDRTQWVLITFAVVRRKNASVPMQAAQTQTQSRTQTQTPYFIAVFQDITPRRLAENELRRVHGTQERRIKARTRELSAAYDELERYSYAVAHDLRSPLRIIDGYVQSIEEDEKTLSEDGKYHLQRIREASQNMGQLIDGLLRLAQFARGGIRRTQVDISAMATRLLEDFGQANPDRKVRWQVEPGMTAHADEALTHAVLSNLLSNAWKYTAKTAEASINVSSSLEGSETWIKVADNGAGFDMDKSGRLYRPFQRLHKDKAFPGLGIGLATVRRIVERHDGHIRAAAQAGAGATFAFTLGPDSGDADSDDV